jgi:hypothetical protein
VSALIVPSSGNTKDRFLCASAGGAGGAADEPLTDTRNLKIFFTYFIIQKQDFSCDHASSASSDKILITSFFVAQHQPLSLLV